VVDEKLAEKLGTPVARGIQLAGVLAGMSAEAAGLQENDVLITLNDHPMMTFQDFAPALAGKKAGDVVKVAYYRGSELHTIDMELARRPVPEQPQTAAALADLMAAEYTKVAEERDALFASANEAQASARPAPEEWSAKETLVHLLYTERWLHMAISCIVGEQRTGGFVNQLELIAALASAYTLDELLFELKKSEAVTVASIRALPESFVTDKRKFFGFVNTLGQGFVQHTRNHFDQIKQALAAAQGS
jgi:membrane-associated protease RseP (regulator of RpoE activity)